MLVISFHYTDVSDVLSQLSINPRAEKDKTYEREKIFTASRGQELNMDAFLFWGRTSFLYYSVSFVKAQRDV